MNFLVSLSPLLAVAAVFVVVQAIGFRILLPFDLASENTFEAGLFAAGLSFSLIEFAVFGLSIPGWLGPRSAWGLIVLVAIGAGKIGWKKSRCWFELLGNGIREQIFQGGLFRRSLLALLSAIVALEALVSTAPLTGSDAMNYHFTAPLLELHAPLHPIYWLTHSFLTEQGHLLISLGMALGSDRISLGFILVGGLLTGATLFALARQMMPLDWSLLTVLLFLATPMIFWQITTSGSPDIWMGFYAALSVLALSRGIQNAQTKYVVLAGFFAGAAAGVKYTGWVIPLALCAYLLLVRRSWKLAFSCGLPSFLAGVLPQLRNFLWTGDPFFPFLMPHMNRGATNFYVLNNLVVDTRAPEYSLRLVHLLIFPFAMVLDGNPYGFGQYFGPLVLAFAPFLLLIKWSSETARIAAVVWAFVFLSNVVSSQMVRYLLPAYALALVLTLSGVHHLFDRNWKAASVSCAATLFLFLGFAFLSDGLYAKSFLPVVFGGESREAFLERMAPQYRFASFINSTIEAQSARGNAMVFLRHLYYLRVPYVYGDPRYSWVMDPAKCDDPEKLLRTLRDLKVRWVVKDPDYPPLLKNSFDRLETEKKLIHIASADLESLTGPSRIYGVRETTRITILEVVE